MDLFNIEPEKYWDPGSTKTKEQKKKIFHDAVDSDLYLASEKKDGHWHRFVMQNGESKMQSRGISTVTGEYGDHTLHVPHLYNFLNKIVDKDTMLIGEIYLPGLKDRDMTSILGCNYEKALDRQEKKYGKVMFMIFDVWFFDGQDFMKTAFEDRVKFLQDVVQPKIKDNPYISIAEYFEGQEIYTKLNDIFENGGEGIVLTKKISFPSPGSRTSKKTIKVKSEIDNDIDVFLTSQFLPCTRMYTGKEIETWQYWENLKTGEKVYGKIFEQYNSGEAFEPITKNYYMGWPGSVEIAVLKGEDQIVTSLGYVSGLTDEIKKDFTENRKRYVFKRCRVSCMEFTPDHKLRHPRFKGFREDINIEDCTYEKIFG